ncbi:MAG: adenylate/guanylate cyclase domain-containing protein [Chloroflexi bacterium]|nr:adenylate/guanylate cyclase domain-containing protein [Chloroflexota bacterium]
MLASFIRRYGSFLARIGADPNDSDQVRVNKIFFLSIAPLTILSGILWGLMYFAFDEPVAASIPLGYSALSFTSIVIFARIRHYGFLNVTQLALILLLPFALQIVLGGFVNSSGVVLWSLLCPFGAIVFSGPRQAIGWFMAYLLTVVVSGVLQPYVRPTNNLSPGIIVFFFVMNFAAISLIAFVLISFFVRQKDAAFGLLRVEQAKSENLLLNILPKEIAARLKNQERTIADYFGETTILFADLVNFTPLAATLSPTEMVELLNQVFSRFDALVEKHDVEKIETVGDEYMAAAGVPRPRADHAQAIARLALDMCDYLASLPSQYDHRLDFRIGINSGPVIAGVIGRKKFAYELFGDTVNTANRMQSHGVAGKIQISPETYELIKDDFVCEPRGKLTIKGKGEMETWFLVGERSQPGN